MPAAAYERATSREQNICFKRGLGPPITVRAASILE